MKIIKCTIDNHRKKFGTEDQCRDFLINIKWPNGYVCKRCEHTEFISGRQYFYRRCKKCRHDESPTSGTIFHSCKLPLVKAFEIVYRIAVNKKGLSGISIAREYGMNQKSADLLRKKIQHVMQSSEAHPLQGLVHVDDFFIGGKDTSKQRKTGRSNSTSKQRACIAVEVLPNGIGRVYIQSIKDFSTNSLRPLVQKFCAKASLIMTDGWVGYSPLRTEYPQMEMKLSMNGSNYQELHTVIMLFKKFLKGTHHYVSEKRMQHYMNEFCYRFNRKSHIESINTNLLAKMVLAKPLPSMEKIDKSQKRAA